MASTSIVYKNHRPQLAVHFVYARDDGHCLKTTVYKIESRCRLNRQNIDLIRAAHLIGGGQSWCIKSQHDGSEAAAGQDLVDAVEINNFTGETVNTKPINKYFGTYYNQIEQSYYEYIIEDSCDSSD